MIREAIWVRQNAKPNVGKTIDPVILECGCLPFHGDRFSGGSRHAI